MFPDPSSISSCTRIAREETRCCRMSTEQSQSKASWAKSLLYGRFTVSSLFGMATWNVWRLHASAPMGMRLESRSCSVQQPHHDICMRKDATKRVECFLVFFLVPDFFVVGGWCRLELCHLCKLWQEKCRIADAFRVLQPNTPFRAKGVATQHFL